MVRSFCGGCFCGSFGGCGTRASRPLGVTGTMTMKIISNTSRMSIIGVMLISPIAPPLLPVENAMALNSSVGSVWLGTIGCCQLTGPCQLHWPTPVLLAPRRSRRFLLVGQEAHFIHAGGTDRVDGI